MMRAAVFFAGLLFVRADNTAYCAVNGARAVDDLLDSATYIWAGTVRCNNNNVNKNTILCSLDIASAIESVNAMVNVILKAVEKCGDLETKNHKCGLAVGVLTRSFAGLAAGVSGIAAKCPNALNNNQPLVPLVNNNLANNVNANNQFGTLAQAQALANQDQATPTSFAQCLVDVKDLTKSLFKATKRIMTLDENCKDGKNHCAHNGLKLAASLAAMGEYLAAAVGRCSTPTAANGKMIVDSLCASQGLDLVRHINNLGRASVDMSKQCDVSAARLYQLENGVETQSGTSSSLTLGLAALLPLTAVIGFLGGSRFAKSRVQPQCEHECLVGDGM